ncbi:D-alanyl-D-alanine carboxypeptidase family protein [Solimonas sp. SE-A11]|uniref:D-alanyl-D-alanine carboxypeptidase family protein n=1 Tax=Solimonas sp. SE-A11 TaxID=3054954 RepID=UPI00259D26D8|nr:D-alanyl-D-alanine carboxypeptidase family protein [Solimonas sp. SE-A11]MDM4771934.1 D-alanyl-D-alanine carboxypeptidase family protein [Solimonas sp. SE-A11]
MKHLLALPLMFLSLSLHAAIPAPPALEASSFALLDYDSGELLAASNPDQRVGPASITKVMTAYVVLEEVRQGRMKLQDTAFVSEKAWRQGIDSSESRMFVQVGTRVGLEELLHGIITQSGNDASVVLAEHVAGSEDAFATMMNQQAAKLGMKNTHFTNAPGMPDAQHYSTAHDLTLLGRALIQNFPAEYKWFALPDYTYNGIKQPNRNLLLKKDPSVDGIKTGHTSEAGYCLLSSAQRDGRRLIAAVMGTKSWAYREQASLELLNWGFRFFESAQLLGPTKPAGTVKVWKGAAAEVQVGTLKPVAITLPRGEAARVQASWQQEGEAIAPFAAGQKLGTLTLTLDGKVLRTEPLVALQDVEKGGFWRRLIDTIRLWFA